MNDELKKIKKKYGENMMHLCRKLFPTLLEKEGLLFSLLESNFSFSKYLYQDIIDHHLEIDFKDYIYYVANLQHERKIATTKTPRELLSKVGYELYECHTEEEIQYFRKYYAPGEEICTFIIGNRLKVCHVFFAVKKNVDEIKRKDFKKPTREDLYGTSVISIQFRRGENNTLSIKNRYNNTVDHPDVTFSNNLDNIIPGLTFAFENTYHLNISRTNLPFFNPPNYVKAKDGKYYKYNYKIMDVYYCPNNIIIDHLEVIKKYEAKEQYIVLDYFILNLKDKQLEFYDHKIEDSFLNGITNIKSIDIIKENEKKIIHIITKEENHIQIDLNNENKIIGYKNELLKEIGDYFLQENDTLENLDLPNVETIGDRFLYENKVLKQLLLPKTKYIKDFFLYYNNTLTEVFMPELEEVGDWFLYYNNSLIEIALLNLKVAGNRFFGENNSLLYAYFPHFIKMGSRCFYSNTTLRKVIFPHLEEIGECSFHDHPLLSKLQEEKSKKY